MSDLSKKIIEDIFAQADIEINGSRPSDIQVINPQFYRRFIKDGRLGLGESYMDQWWECLNLEEMFFKLFTANIKQSYDLRNLNFYLTLMKAKLFPYGSKEKSKDIGPHHYDHGNTLYRLMLGETMQYTCGYWKDAVHLDEAQEAKMALIGSKLYLKPGMSVLDVGCGWGNLAKYLAEHHHVNVTGITVSQQQLVWAKKICEGLPVDLRYQDYRDTREKFDRIIAVGMFEHVGLKYHKTFMNSMRQCLNDHGLFLMQTITSSISNWSNQWLDKYIFPGAYPASMKEIAAATEGQWVIEDVHNFGADYFKTIMAWYDNFEKTWDQIRNHYNERFYRMWKYYLLSVAAGFRARGIQLNQFVFSKDGILEGYHSLR